MTGLRGSGKSKLGKMIAAKIGWKFVDLDKEIEKQEGRSITEIVEKRGWEYFRAAETKAISSLEDLENTIIATGGGAIIDPDNEKELKKNGKIVYFYVKPEICAERIMESKNRPPLTNKESLEEEMKQLYQERNFRYCKSAFMVFERTEDLEIDRDELIDRLSLTKTKA